MPQPNPAGFVALLRLNHLAEQAEAVARQIREITENPDLILAQSTVHANATRNGDGASGVRAHPNPITVSRAYTYADAAIELIDTSEAFPLDGLLAVLRPRLVNPPMRLKEVVRQSLQRDKRFTELVGDRKGWFVTN